MSAGCHLLVTLETLAVCPSGLPLIRTLVDCAARRQKSSFERIFAHVTGASIFGVSLSFFQSASFLHRIFESTRGWVNHTFDLPNTKFTLFLFSSVGRKESGRWKLNHRREAFIAVIKACEFVKPFMLIFETRQSRWERSRRYQSIRGGQLGNTLRYHISKCTLKPLGAVRVSGGEMESWKVDQKTLLFCLWVMFWKLADSRGFFELITLLFVTLCHWRQVMVRKQADFNFSGLFFAMKIELLVTCDAACLQCFSTCFNENTQKLPFPTRLQSFFSCHSTRRLGTAFSTHYTPKTTRNSNANRVQRHSSKLLGRSETLSVARVAHFPNAWPTISSTRTHSRKTMHIPVARFNELENLFRNCRRQGVSWQHTL